MRTLLNLGLVLSGLPSLAYGEIKDSCKDVLRNISPHRIIYGFDNGTSVPITAERRRSIDRVHVVVPVYRELKSGNLGRLLKTLKSQTLDPRKLQVTLVVNNHFDHAQKKTSIYGEN